MKVIKATFADSRVKTRVHSLFITRKQPKRTKVTKNSSKTLTLFHGNEIQKNFRKIFLGQLSTVQFLKVSK